MRLIFSKVVSYIKQWRITIKRKCYLTFISKFDEDDANIHIPKNPPMPECIAMRQVQSLSFMCSQVISSTRSSDIDFTFLKDVTSTENCPEWIGYNTRLCRESGIAPSKKAKTVYVPLIQKVPNILEYSS